MTTGHLTATMHNGMLRSDRNYLELSVADRWTGGLGDVCEIQDTRERGRENKRMGERVKKEGDEGERVCADNDKELSCYRVE